MLALKPPHRPLSAVTTHEQDALASPRSLEQGMGVGWRARGHAVQDLHHLPRVGPGREHRLLGAAQLGRRDHLHGLGDLLRVLDAADPPADVDEGGHGALLAPRPSSRPWPGRRRANSSRAAFSLSVELALEVLLLRDLLRGARGGACRGTGRAPSRSGGTSETGYRVEVAVRGREDDERPASPSGSGLYWSCFRISVRRWPRGEHGLGRLVEVGGEHGEGGQLAVLREVEAQAAGHRLHGLDLRGAADAARRSCRR